jgi:hypothetical protein
LDILPANRFSPFVEILTTFDSSSALLLSTYLHKKIQNLTLQLKNQLKLPDSLTLTLSVIEKFFPLRRLFINGAACLSEEFCFDLHFHSDNA